MNLHQVRIPLGMQHRLLGPVALNLQNLDRRLCRFALQIEGLP